MVASVKLGLESAKFYLKTNQISPEFGPIWAELDHCFANIDQIWSNIAKTWDYHK